jgi:hypothetical protein
MDIFKEKKFPQNECLINKKIERLSSQTDISVD